MTKAKNISDIGIDLSNVPTNSPSFGFYTIPTVPKKKKSIKIKRKKLKERLIERLSDMLGTTYLNSEIKEFAEKFVDEL